MKNEFIRRGTCELCGEEADLFVWTCLPDHLEDLEGVCCTGCGEQHEDERERRQEIERQRQEDKMFDDWAEHSDMLDDRW